MRNDYLLKTADACTVARLDRTRYNEAVKAGALAFVPEAETGRSRYFDEDQETGLYIFARLVEQGTSVSRAGTIADWVYRECRSNEERQIAVCYATNGSSFVKKGTELPADIKTMTPPPWRIDIFDVDNIRADLMGGVNYLRRIVGGHEESE